MTTQKSRRRWFQFRLRTLFVVLTLFAILFAAFYWVRSEYRQRRREQQAVMWVEEMGGSVAWPSDDAEASWWKRRVDSVFGPTVQAVYLQNTLVTDLSALRDLKYLESLYLNGTRVAEEQIESLQRALPNCKVYHSKAVP